MSRWKQLFGGTSEVEDSPTPARRTGDTAFEVFLVDNGLTAIYNETKSARGKEQRHIRDCCKKLLGEAVELPICLPGEKSVAALAILGSNTEASLPPMLQWQSLCPALQMLTRDRRDRCRPRSQPL